MSEKMYNMKDLGINALVGRFIKSAAINDDKDYVRLDTETGPLHLSWNGDCCAKCYLAHVNGVEFLIGATITKAENTEWSQEERKDCYDDVTETMGTTIWTNKGVITFESRVEHNGYYSGEITVSDDEAIDAYNCPRIFLGMEGILIMSMLNDF